MLVSGLLLPSALPVTAATQIGIDVSAMDKSVKPGDDFYNYANGSWMKSTEIAADKPGAGAFFVAADATDKHKTDLVQQILQARVAKGSNEERIANFYKAFVDVGQIEQLGMQPMHQELQQIEQLNSKKALAAALGASVRTDVDPLNASDFYTENLFGIFVSQGLTTPGVVMPYLLQGGLGLPEREYYLSGDDDADLRQAYKSYIAELLTLAGYKDAAERAERIFALEMKIAKAHISREQSEEFVQSTAVWQRQDFAVKAPGLDWEQFFQAAELAGQSQFAAYHAGAITQLSALVQSEPLQSWKDWLLFHQINSHTDVLPSALDQSHFNFYGATLMGLKKQKSRERRALTSLDKYLGDAVGQVYVKQYFPAENKALISGMVKQIVTAFGKRVENIDWMAESTKKEALAKVQSVVVGIGYPDQWRDYGHYNPSPTNAYGNMVAAEKFEYRYQLAKAGKPLDKNEWWMNAQTVNAVNLPVQNALNFPAGILQFPFYVAGADAAYNYGAIGATIGHELSHSFDDDGAAFNAQGVLKDWWTQQDYQKFTAQGQALIEQYDAYYPFPDLHVNGALTLGENIADLAGLAAAYDAYRASLNGKEAAVIDGFTGDQRFFIGYAQTWTTKMRERTLRQRIAVDGHAPGMYRALTVRNLDAWYKAFNVKPGDKLYLAPEKRVRIW